MATQGMPSWLLDSKEHITRSKEWNGFVEELYDAIQQQLTESHVQAFTDLTEAERMLFMERATKAIQGGHAYKELFDKVSVSLDQHLNNDVARQLLEDYPINTKSDLVLDAAQDGLVSLLKKWPDMKSKLHVTLNQPLPENLRQVAWRLYLDNTKVRKRYVDLLTNNPRSAISPLDLEISQRCEQIMMSEPAFSQIRGSVGAFYAMKATLSYHHNIKKSKERLLDVDYMLVVPFIYVSLPAISRREPAPNTIVALLVEEYLTFMELRPGCVADSGSQVHNDQYKAFVEKVAKILKEKSPETAKIISKIFVPSKEKIVATEHGSQLVLSEGLTSLLRPVIRTMFVGYVNMEVALFLWDQFMIGLDAPGYQNDLLPVVTAVYLMLLSPHIKDIQTPEQLHASLKQNGQQLKVPHFQYEINHHFYKQLYTLLTQEDRSALPVLDPTQAQNHPPWLHWFSDRIPPRTTPGERRKARDEREGERQRLLQQQRNEERMREANEAERRRKADQDMYASQESDRQLLMEERLALEEALEDERRQREEAEAAAQAEIERLRRELQAVNNAKRVPKTPGANTLESRISRYLIPPPPTAASNYVPPTPIGRITPRKTPTVVPKGKSPQTQTQDAIKRFIRKVAHSFNRIGHGEGSERSRLDHQTKEAIRQHREDVKLAEVEVFGRALRQGEFNELSDEDQEAKSEQIMDVIKRRLQERRKQQLKAGQI